MQSPPDRGKPDRAKPDPARALGRGLSALLPNRSAPPAAPAQADVPVVVNQLPIDRIDPNPIQPRRIFKADRMEELAQSIRANGIIQPLVVRKAADRYQIVAGERRWRAARLANLSEVPVVVEDVSDERLLEVTLIENIQREDLNPIEAAQAFQRLATELKVSHEEIGKRTGKDRSTITNLLRLLQLPKDLQELVAERQLSAGHARCLLSISDPKLQRELGRKAVTQAWSVRQLERVTQKMTAARDPKEVPETDQDPNVKAAIQELERVLGTKVKIIEKSKERGRIEIEYYSGDDLDRIYNTIVGTP